MEELLRQAEEALRQKDGKMAMELADRILDQDETCVTAWLVAMKSFQLVLPIQAYKAENELECARYAIRFAKKEEKYGIRMQIYTFFMNKILAVLKRDEEVLADGRSIVSFYQRVFYFDATNATRRTLEEDRPVTEAVRGTFTYCSELFDFIPDSAIKRSARLNKLAAEVADQWQRTYSRLEMRYELCHTRMTTEGIEYGLRQYARYLQAVKTREELIKVPVTFNIDRLDQSAFLE